MIARLIEVYKLRRYKRNARAVAETLEINERTVIDERGNPWEPGASCDAIISGEGEVVFTGQFDAADIKWPKETTEGDIRQLNECELVFDAHKIAELRRKRAARLWV